MVFDWYKKKLSNIIIVLLVSFSIFISPVALADTALQEQEMKKVHLRAVLTPPYVLGPGDILLVIDRTLQDIFGKGEEYDLRIAPDGYISVPLPDGRQQNVLAAGFTISEVAEEIRRLYSETLIVPRLIVQIAKYRPINVYIGGAIKKPGFYNLERSSTNVKNATLTKEDVFNVSLTEVLQISGGLIEDADITNITLTRGTSAEKITVNLKNLITGSATFNDVNLQPGDAIYVASTKDPEKQAYSHVKLLGELVYGGQWITVDGEVKERGRFSLPNDATLLDAIATAGGPTFVSNLNDVVVDRLNQDGEYETLKFNVNDLIMGGATLNELALKPNDRITINPSKKRVLMRFGRNALQQSVPIITGTVAGAVAGFIVQDNFFSRITKAQRSVNSRSGFSDLGGTDNNITIIGGVGDE